VASLLDFLRPNGQPGGLLGNLQPEQDPQAQAQPGAPGAAAPPGGGFGAGVGNFLSNNPLMLMALGGGIAQGGIGRGLTAAVPAAQYEQQQQKQQAVQGVTYDALRSAGVPHGQALAGALNPVMLKTIAQSHFDAKPTFEMIGQDPQGRPTYGFVDPSRKSVTPYQPPNISSLDTAVGHLGNLMEASNKLDSTSAGRDGYAARKLELARNAAADQMAKVLRADGMGDEEIRSWTDSLGTSNSPMELRAVVGRGIELMNSRLAALNAQYERAIGRSAPAWLSPKSSAMLERIRQWASEGRQEQGGVVPSSAAGLAPQMTERR
jgi:hypothetical protein